MKFIAIGLLALFSLLAQAAEKTPAAFASLTELRSWIEERKGFGIPESVETSLDGLHVLVVWNCPFSGRNGHYAWAYVERETMKQWRLADSSFFERPEPLGYAYVDGLAKSVVYVGTSGRVLKSIPLPGLRFK
jgi:hypothetical protein